MTEKIKAEEVIEEIQSHMSEEEFAEYQREIFSTLSSANVNEHVEKKKSGSVHLSYLSWAWAWSVMKKNYPTATYEIKKFDNGRPYLFDENTGYMVFTSVTVEGMTYEMWLPVMDGSNKAMKDKPYTYDTKKVKGNRVESATMFDINKAIMRCLVKNLAMFGLGLYIYAGEDLPEEPEVIMPKPEKVQLEELHGKFKTIGEMTRVSPKSVEARLLAYIKHSGKLEAITLEQFDYLNNACDQQIKKLEQEKQNQKEEQTDEPKWGQR